MYATAIENRLISKIGESNYIFREKITRTIKVVFLDACFFFLRLVLRVGKRSLKLNIYEKLENSYSLALEVAI